MQKFTERGVPMAYSNSKGLIALPTDYSDKNGYTWQKLSYHFVQPSGITITPKQMQDLDSYRNGNGVLKRTVLDHSPTKIEWNTPYLTYEDKCKLIHQIRNGYRQGVGLYKARRIRIRYYKMIMIPAHFICRTYSFSMADCIMEHHCICQSVWQQ